MFLEIACSTQTSCKNQQLMFGVRAAKSNSSHQPHLSLELALRVAFFNNNDDDDDDDNADNNNNNNNNNNKKKKKKKQKKQQQQQQQQQDNNNQRTAKSWLCYNLLTTNELKAGFAITSNCYYHCYCYHCWCYHCCCYYCYCCFGFVITSIVITSNCYYHC